MSYIVSDNNNAYYKNWWIMERDDQHHDVQVCATDGRNYTMCKGQNTWKHIVHAQLNIE